VVLIGRLTTVPTKEPSADVAGANVAEPPRGDALLAQLRGRNRYQRKLPELAYLHA